MAEDSSLIHTLNAKVLELQGELANSRAKVESLEGEASRRKDAGRTLRQQVEALTSEREALAKERDTLKAVATPEGLQAEVDRLKVELRTRDHKAAFREVASELGILPGAVEDAWVLSKYTAESETPDPAAIKASLEGAVSSRPWLVAPAGGQPAAEPHGSTAGPQGPAPTPNPALPPGPGGGRQVVDRAHSGGSADVAGWLQATGRKHVGQI